MIARGYCDTRWNKVPFIKTKKFASVLEKRYVSHSPSGIFLPFKINFRNVGIKYRSGTVAEIFFSENPIECNNSTTKLYKDKDTDSFQVVLTLTCFVNKYSRRSLWDKMSGWSRLAYSIRYSWQPWLYLYR